MKAHIYINEKEVAAITGLICSGNFLLQISSEINPYDFTGGIN